MPMKLNGIISLNSYSLKTRNGPATWKITYLYSILYPKILNFYQIKNRRIRPRIKIIERKAILSQQTSCTIIFFFNRILVFLRYFSNYGVVWIWCQIRTNFNSTSFLTKSSFLWISLSRLISAAVNLVSMSFVISSTFADSTDRTSAGLLF